MTELIGRLTTRFRVAIASNNPHDLTVRALNALGFGPILHRLPIFCPEDTETSKTDPAFYRAIARSIGVSPERCVVVGDREETDITPAVHTGMSAILVKGPADVANICCSLLFYRAPFDCSAMVRDVQSPAGVTLIGMTGQAAAGKTWLSHECLRRMQQQGTPTARLELDAFFRLSSRQRKQWLQDGRALGPGEHTHRANQLHWWDFDRFRDAVNKLRTGKELRLERVYNRADSGELSGTVVIRPEPEMVIFVDGVAIAHLPDLFDALWMLHAAPRVRLQRLQNRDKHRAGPEALERFRITESFERTYFAAHRTARVHIDNTNHLPLVLTGAPDFPDDPLPSGTTEYT